MDLLALPHEVLVAILSQLETKAEIAKAARVSKKLQAAANDELLWETLANRRYGSHVVRSTRSMYNNGSYKDMMKDDNRLGGALPTRVGLWKCPWRYNTPHRFYCCLIVCIKWHRSSNMLWLYLDARGQSDLRRPQTSGIWLREPNNGASSIVRLDDRVRQTHVGILGVRTHLREYVFVPEDPDNDTDDRFKGVLQIDANLFTRPGSYEFCYANPVPSQYRDYQDCTLFTLENGQSLMDVFTSFSLEDESPFASDTEAIWNERWGPHLPWPASSGVPGGFDAVGAQSGGPSPR